MAPGRSVSFRKLKTIMPMPNMLDVQLRSFEKLVEVVADPVEQWDFGLDRVFGEIFPISDVNENFTLEYVSNALGEPKYSVEECIERDMTYAAPLKATLRLIVWEELEDSERRPRDIIEKEVYLGDLPLLTELGTFIINGAERVVVSQLPPVPWRRVRGECSSQRNPALQRPHHSVPGLLGRVHARYQRHLLRPYRQEEEIPRDGAASGLRVGNGRRWSISSSTRWARSTSRPPGGT